MGQIRTIVRIVFEALNARDLACVRRWIDVAYLGTDTGQAAQIVGRAELEEVMRDYLRAFPNLQFRITEILERPDEAAITWEASGTHKGWLLHLAPTYRRVTVTGIWVVQLEHTRIRSGRSTWDASGLLAQLGYGLHQLKDAPKPNRNPEAQAGTERALSKE
jgi:predicted ester cyclase